MAKRGRPIDEYKEERHKLQDIIDNQAKKIKELENENKKLRRVWVNE